MHASPQSLHDCLNVLVFRVIPQMNPISSPTPWPSLAFTTTDSSTSLRTLPSRTPLLAFVYYKYVESIASATSSALFPHPLVLQFVSDRDVAVASTFFAIQQAHPPEASTHSLPVGAGGAYVTSLAKHANGSYLGAFFRVDRPLHQRLNAMGGITNRSVAAQLVHPPLASHYSPWASFVNDAHSAALTLQLSFSDEEKHSMNLIAPRGCIITSAGDPSSVSQDLTPTLQLDVTPPLSQAAATPKGARFVASSLRKLREWRSFFSIHGSSSQENKPKLLTHSGHSQSCTPTYPLDGRCRHLLRAWPFAASLVPQT